MMIENVIKINGSPDELARLRKLVQKNGSDFNFEEVINEPYELKNITPEAALTNAREIELLSKYGATSINEWRKFYWGNTWNSSEVKWVSDGFVKIQTMVDTARGIFRELTNLFDVSIDLLYFDTEDFTGGVIRFNKGSYEEVKASKEEAEVISWYSFNSRYDFHMWLEAHTKAKNSKKIDMEILFNYDTPVIEEAKKILDIE